MSTFDRSDYERLVKIARILDEAAETAPAAMRRTVLRRLARTYAAEIFQMCENVVGQQSPPLGGHR